MDGPIGQDFVLLSITDPNGYLFTLSGASKYEPEGRKIRKMGDRSLSPEGYPPTSLEVGGVPQKR